MRVLQLIALIALASSCAAASAATDSDTTGVAKIKTGVDVPSRVLAANHKQTKRSLRRYEDEERGIPISDKLDDVVSKVDDVVGVAGKEAKATSKWEALIKKNADKITAIAARAKKLSVKSTQVDEVAEMAARSALVTKLSERYNYADKLSLSALKQLDEIEKVRLVDIEKGIKGTKTTANGMRRDITTFEGMKTAPKKYLESHVGRNQQRFGKDGSRLLSANVVTRLNEKGEKQILLISSSNPKKGDFLLPKGGWDKGENIKKAALREVIEEGGVGGQLAHGLGKVKFQEGADKYTYYAYLMKSSTVYDDWSESIRYRLWVSMDEAIEMLAGRPNMAEVVKRAQHVDNKIKAGILPEVNPGLAKVKLDGTT
ncbi:hypothetical protein PC110_g8318 [Phytophthora cactorum]|uniref:RxLR effector protein n=1 Tax=Phytophthora cactorum TaxID=29920 RepID=A0A329SFF2_9STRA|nr:hypothetical protein PC110_g8318 [Phytophthora cactorum]